MTSDKEIVVDLTSSFNLCNHNSLSDTIIVIDSDDSFDYSSESKKKKELDSGNENKLIKGKTVSPITKKSTENELKRTLNKFGDCAICWEEIGKNPLASTKCGHVFCITCLKKSLKVLNRCPTCRCSLNGKSAYHPLYLSKQE